MSEKSMNDPSVEKEAIQKFRNGKVVRSEEDELPFIDKREQYNALSLEYKMLENLQSMRTNVRIITWVVVVPIILGVASALVYLLMEVA